MTPSVEDDVAYLKELAEAGATAVPSGGQYFLVWGVAISVGLAVTYVAVTGAAPISQSTLTYSWCALIAAGWVVSFVIGRPGTLKSEGVRFANRIVGVTWLAAGLAMTSIWLGLVVSGAQQALMMPIASAVLGVGTAVSGTIFRLTWLYAVAAAWLAVAFVSFLMLRSVEFILFSAAAILILQGGTGLALLLLERRQRR